MNAKYAPISMTTLLIFPPFLSIYKSMPALNNFKAQRIIIKLKANSKSI